LHEVDIITGESTKEKGWKDMKTHLDSTFMSDMTGTRDKCVGTRDQPLRGSDKEVSECFSV
jgi:hypothetical protein